jgi:hypothetical protein
MERSKEIMKEARTRTILKSMVNAIDACDDKTYWEAFEMLLAVHKELLEREHHKMVAGQAKLDEMPESEKLGHCAGCHDDFYNQAGNSSGGRCWMLAKMTLVQRKEVSIDQRPPWNQKSRLLPHCYHKPRFVYVKPDQTC